MHKETKAKTAGSLKHQKHKHPPDIDRSNAAGNVNDTGYADVEVAPEVVWTRGMAIRTRAFWIVTLGLQVIVAMSMSVFFWLPQILEEAHVPIDLLPGLALVMSISSVVTGVIVGVVLDRVSAHYVLATALLIQSTTMLAFAEFLLPSTAFLIMILQGAANSTFTSVMLVVYAQYFGRSHLGAVSGTGLSVVMIGSAIGPFPIGLLRDLFGSFEVACLVMSIFPFLFSIIVFLFGSKPHLPNTEKRQFVAQ